MRTLSSSLTTLGHLGCDRRGDQSGGDKELHFGTMVAEKARRCATAPPDAFSDQVLESRGATPHVDALRGRVLRSVAECTHAAA